MNTSTIILIASIIAVTGKWTRGEGIDSDMVVGGIFLALFLTLMSEANEGLASKFAWLVLFAVAGSNADDVLKAIGFATTSASDKTPGAKINGGGNPIANTPK